MLLMLWSWHLLTTQASADASEPICPAPHQTSSTNASSPTAQLSSVLAFLLFDLTAQYPSSLLNLLFNLSFLLT